MERPPPADRPARRGAAWLYAWPALLAALLAFPAPAPGPPPAAAQDVGPGGRRHLIFAATYHTADRDGGENDYLVLGHYDFLDGRNAVINYWSYDGNLNTQAIAATVRNPRLQSGRALLRPGPIHLPGYAGSGFKQFRATWTTDRHMLRVRVGDVIHDWVLRDPAEGLYVVAGPYVSALDASHTLGGLTFSNGHGYAYLAEQVKLARRLTPRDLLPDYDGELYTRHDEDGKGFRWALQDEGLHVKQYRAFRGGDVLARSEMSTGLSPPLLWQSTLLLNYAPYSKLLLYLNGSHDFNRNGVFDEVGHTLQLFGIFAGGKVRHMVFVEYSHQDNGRPILGVGRYCAPGGTTRR
jgi:hypothetical protein